MESDSHSFNGIGNIFLLLLPLNNNDTSYNLFHSCQVPGKNTNDFLYSVASGSHNI